MAPAFGNIKYSEFDGGDSIIQATTLTAAYNQLMARWGRAVKAYNSANPSVALVQPDSAIDPDTSTKTTTFSLLTQKVYNAVSRKFENQFRDYVDETYTNWVVPTDGDLEGCPSMAEALDLVANAMKQCYDLLQPNQFVADPSGFASITDNTDGAIEYSISFLVTEGFNAISGDPEYQVTELLTILDEQQGV